MSDQLLRLYVWQLYAFTGPATKSRRRQDERGEGVISTAIAVLIMAFLGVVVWVGFKATLGNTQKKVDNQVEQIGQ